MPNKQNLKRAIPIHKRKDHKEVSAKGGRARTKAKKRANQITGYRSKKCKNCKGCAYKRQFIETDPEHKCKFPDYLYALEEVIIDPEKMKNSIFWESYLLSKLAKTPRERKMSFDALVEFKEQYIEKPLERVQVSSTDVVIQLYEERKKKGKKKLRKNK